MLPQLLQGGIWIILLNHGLLWLDMFGLFLIEICRLRESFLECSWPEESVQIEMINFFRSLCQEASEHAQPAPCRRKFLKATFYLAHSRQPTIYGLPPRRHSLHWGIHRYHCPCSGMIPKRVTSEDAEDINVIQHHPIITLSASLLCQWTTFILV